MFCHIKIRFGDGASKIMIGTLNMIHFKDSIDVFSSRATYWFAQAGKTLRLSELLLIIIKPVSLG